ncbi:MULTISPECIES: hypothetical protein [unclassified Shinella]|uniref:hypothetical protein n=1 Tax=unclassified Shinella TaxID=2643062 RepID=UPI00225C6769|nr:MULTISPECIES: hypothetical protein [unclassified Shinella]MCO5137429.1 hypothetical protein [Shinella sp.]MDC7257393.1 hypothetical protein [Shinella sp. YE25]CAI0340285.1 conserved hypothetical protein [Rhizobiaceae bacterium]CAK7258657.1 conserved protein of unknown function [Shinella sp. WSC3-e]
MNGHPDKLLSDLELHNFAVFLKANPHLTHPAPEGAFDGVPKNMRRVPGKPLRVPVSDFSKGGKFDASRYGFTFDEGEREARKPALDIGALRKLATSLSEEGWAAIRKACVEADAEDSEEDEDERAPAKDTPLDPDMIAGNGKEEVRAADRAIQGPSSFAQRWPEMASIKSDAPLVKPKTRQPISAASAKSFAERWPDAARIGAKGR